MMYEAFEIINVCYHNNMMFSNCRHRLVVVPATTTTKETIA